VRARTLDGEIGILPRHIPLLGVLVEAPVTIRRSGEGDLVANVSGGFLSVSGYVIYFTRKSKRPKPVARAEKPGRETAAKEHADAEAELVPAR
jgi:F0F1-type ATP synthase epsilon subunit